MRLPLLAVCALALTGCPDRSPDIPFEDLAPSVDGPTLSEDVVLQLPICDGGVLVSFGPEAVAPPGPSSDGWLPPESDTLSGIQSSYLSLIEGDGMLAFAQVAVVGYTVCRGEGDEADLVLWRPASTGTGRAQFAWRWRDARPVLVEAPHAFADVAGPLAEIAAFHAAKARALISAGSHPCANAVPDGCGTESTLCNGAAGADPLMNEGSVFHLAHELFSEDWPDDWVLSLQAMYDSGAALSDGTMQFVDGGSMVQILGTELLVELDDTNVTSCNGLSGADPGRRFCGTGGVQARHSNGVADVCEEAPEDSSGRFLQVVRSPAVRARLDVVADALVRALDADGR